MHIKAVLLICTCALVLLWLGHALINRKSDCTAIQQEVDDSQADFMCSNFFGSGVLDIFNPYGSATNRSLHTGLPMRNATDAQLPHRSLNGEIHMPSATNVQVAHDKEVVVTVMTSSVTAESRLKVLHPIFMEAANNSEGWFVTVLYFSDSGIEPEGLANAIFVQTPCGEGNGMSLVCKLRFSMEYVHTHHPRMKWLLRVTDDTYVNIPNLVSFVAAHNSSMDYCISEIYNYKGYRYPHGGAGWLMSRVTVDRFVSKMDQFIQLVKETPMFADDIAVGMFIKKVMNVRLTQGRGFYDEYLQIRNGRVFVLGTYRKYQHASNRFIASRPIAYHMRLGRQIGNPRATPARVEFAQELHQVVQRISHTLPIS